MAKRLAVLAGALAACWLGAYLGAWWVPFPVGVAAGLLGARGWPGRGGVLALSSLPVGATARVIAALAGLPPYAGVTVAVTVLLAAVQVLAGAWLARAVFPGAAASGAPDLTGSET